MEGMFDRELFEAIDDPVFVHAPDGVIVAVNRRAAEVFGAPERDLVARSLEDLSVPSEGFTTARFLEAVAEVDRSGRAYVEWRSRRVDGTAFESQLRLCRARLGGSRCVLVTVLDVTADRARLDALELVRRQEALRAGEARLRAVTEHTPAFILETDASGVIEYVNRTRPGVDVRDILGSNVLEWVVPTERERLQACLRRAAAGDVVADEFVSYDAAGDVRSFTAVFAPILVDGLPTRIAMTALDVTQQRRTEAAAHASEQRLFDVAAQVPGALYQYRLQPDGMGVFPFASGRIAEHYGVRPDALASDGSAIFTWIHPDDIPPMMASRDASARTLQLWQFEHRIVRPDGVTRWMEGVALPRREDDGSVLWNGYVLDISGRKAVEAERERLIADLEVRHAEMEQFTYTVSHDLKSPLVTIRGFLGMLQRDLDAGDLDMVRSDIGRIESAADKMARLLDDLLELSRVGRRQDLPTLVGLDEVVHDALELVLGPLVERGVRVRVQRDLPAVIGDRLRLVQVVQNLVENASKYMGDQPDPTVDVGVRPDPADVICFVRDNGIGLDPKYHERVFSLFEKLDPAAEGTGVGLALVRRVVEHHGGRVWVESDGPGCGCTFLFALPRPPEAG